MILEALFLTNVSFCTITIKICKKKLKILHSDIVCTADSIIHFKLMSSDLKARKSVMMLCPMITHKTSVVKASQSPQKELAVLVVCP